MARVVELGAAIIFFPVLITGWATHDGTVIVVALVVGAVGNITSYVLRRRSDRRLRSERDERHQPADSPHNS